MAMNIGPLGPRLSDVHRIALLRGGGLGDLVFVLPAAQALRDAYPDAELVLLGTPAHAELLRDRPGPIDTGYPLPVAAGVFAGPETITDAEFFRQVTQKPIDLAVQAHGGGRWSNPFLLRLGARHTIGTRSQDAVELDRWLPYRYYQHEALRWLEVVGLAGATGDITPRLSVTDRDRDEADAALRGLPEPTIVLHPGATDPRRRWPAQRFADVAARLADAGHGVAVLGSADERDLVERVVGSAGRGANAVGLAGRLSLSGLVGVLARAAVVVANDSGPRHLAEAVGTPTVGLFWCGNVINAGPFGRAVNRVLIGWTVHCPVCGAALTDGGGGPDCGHDESWVDGIAADVVFHDVCDLLQRVCVGHGQNNDVN